MGLCLFIFFESITWALDGLNTPFLIKLNFLLNSILYLINSLPVVVWVVYFDYKIMGDLDGLKKRIWLYLIPFYFDFILIIFNIRTQFVFTLSEDNIFERGVGVYLIAGLTYLLVWVMFLVSLRYRKYIAGGIVNVMFWFMVMPIVSSILQIFFLWTCNHMAHVYICSNNGLC